ncbi:MAG: mycothiol system anti-sigma-R factor [Actinomycetota bacterium]
MDDDECGEVLQRVHDFLDGELTAERLAEIQSHLGGCGHCLEAFDFEAELKLAIRATCREQVPAGLKERIRATLEAEGA